jgi:hypothetical protein
MPNHRSLLLLLLLSANGFIPGGIVLQYKTGHTIHTSHKITYYNQGNPKYPKLQKNQYALLRLRNE